MSKRSADAQLDGGGQSDNVAESISTLLRVGRSVNKKEDHEIGKRSAPDFYSLSWKKRLGDSLRLGKRSMTDSMRLGKRDLDSMRLGKRRMADSMRLGRRSLDSMRLGNITL